MLKVSNKNISFTRYFYRTGMIVFREIENSYRNEMALRIRVQHLLLVATGSGELPGC